MSLQIGLYVPTWPAKGGATPRWPEIRSLALDAEALGVDSLWVADEPGTWECWTILSAVAGATSRIGVGPLVACTRYRDPGLLVTMARAFDEVSGGRLTLGLGSGFGAKDPRWTAFGLGRHEPRVALRGGRRDRHAAAPSGTYRLRR
jgi:alkanesulfonate monooxygenase SsuD/methylene tetrahydromethanopterin reductase-like flavin-dependent oxidoreductase (luciferase family)